MKYKFITSLVVLAGMTTAAFAADYTLRAGDQLSIMITQEQDISTTTQNSNYTPYQIRPPGKVSVPLV